MLSRLLMARLRRPCAHAAAIARAARAELTWRRVLMAEAVGLVVCVLRSLDGWGSTHHIVARIIFTTVGPLLLVVAALIAAETVRRGASPLRAYSVALLATACASAAVQFMVRQLLGVHPKARGMISGAMEEWVWVCSDIQPVLLLGGIALLAFHNHRSVERILRNLRAVELKHVRLENELIESRLATAHAQVDPRTLFESLARIRNLYLAASPEADPALQALIQTLRTRRALSSAPTGGLGS